MVCPFLTAEEPWRDALDYELVRELLLEDPKMPDCVIAAGFSFHSWENFVFIYVK